MEKYKINLPGLMPRFRLWGLFVLAGIVMMTLGGCDTTAGKRVRLGALAMAPLPEMPDYVQQAPREVQEAYRFAVANPELLQQMPCYCGCNAMGHMNNLDCYVDELGQLTEFDNHAAY